MEAMQRLKNDYPWTQTPLVASAPMRLISLAEMAVAVSKAGNLPPSSQPSSVTITVRQPTSARHHFPLCYRNKFLDPYPL